jgi:GAF domain-containing protein
VTIVFETARSARIDDYADATGPPGVAARDTGVRSAVGTPITVEGRLWGIVVAGSRREQPLPADSETRLASFTGLVATAIANAESRAGLTGLQWSRPHCGASRRWWRVGFRLRRCSRRL